MKVISFSDQLLALKYYFQYWPPNPKSELSGGWWGWFNGWGDSWQPSNGWLAQDSFCPIARSGWLAGWCWATDPREDSIALAGSAVKVSGGWREGESFIAYLSEGWPMPRLQTPLEQRRILPWFLSPCIGCTWCCDVLPRLFVGVTFLMINTCNVRLSFVTSLGLRHSVCIVQAGRQWCLGSEMETVDCTCSEAAAT